MSATIVRVRALLYLVLHPKRLLALLAGFLAAAAYVWVAGVRAVPLTRRRKAARREAWRRRARTSATP